mmetsp:Transcript_10759/g.14046  ORF Transcript_10759/g.14046 Transcript_10759/m.14046 type:complete len:296 (+) Transcript_10759:1324-2211(+)
MTDWGPAEIAKPQLNSCRLYATALRRTAAVVRDRGHITDGSDVEADCSQCAQCGFTTRTGALNFDFQSFNAVILRFFACIFSSHLSSIRGRLTGTLEAHGACGGPGNRVALHVRDQNLGVVERGVHMCNARGDVLTLFALNASLIACHWSDPPLFLLTSDGLCGAFAGTSVGVGTLTANGQVTTVTQTTVATQIHQTFDVHGHFAAQVAFDGVVGVDVLTDGQNFGIRQLVDATGAVDAYSFADCFCGGGTDTGDICEGDWYPLCSRDVNAGNTCHVSLSFSLRFRSAGTFFHNT